LSRRLPKTSVFIAPRIRARLQSCGKRLPVRIRALAPAALVPIPTIKFGFFSSLFNRSSTASTTFASRTKEKGHDFSRAASPQNQCRALAPAGISAGNLQPAKRAVASHIQGAKNDSRSSTLFVEGNIRKGKNQRT